MDKMKTPFALLVRSVFSMRVGSLRALGTAMILAMCSGTCVSQTLDYGTFSGFGLGKGILGDDYSHPLASCITGTQSALIADQASVNVSIVYTDDEYSRAFHIDQSAKATFLGVGGGGDDLHFGQEDSRATRAFDIIVEAFGEHPSQTLNNIDWDKRHSDMLKSADPAAQAAVRVECGDRYIETVFNESRLFAVLHVSSQQNSSLTQFSGKANGSLDLKAVSASATLGGDLNIKSAHQAGAITIDIYSEGLGGIIPTAAAVGIASGDGLQDISSKLSTYLTGLHDNGEPVKYRLAALPGMNIGNFTDQTIFDDLTEMKDKYNDTYARLSNVKSLLGAGDPRRALFIEPDADTDLKRQQVILKKYVGDAATAHDTCTKAASRDVCENANNGLGNPPAAVAVELPSVLAPKVGPFQIAINGRIVSPTNLALVFRETGSTVLAAAKKNVQSDAENVDILAILVAPYLSNLDIPILTPIGPAGALVIRSQDLKFPPYWKEIPANALAIHVAHADANSPCPIKLDGGAHTLDDSCLTVVGKALRDVVLTAGAEETVPGVPSFTSPFGGFSVDCFGTSTWSLPPLYTPFVPGAAPWQFPINFGWTNANMALSLPQITTTVRASLLTATPNLYFEFLVSSEKRDYSGWRQTAANRLAAIPVTGLGLDGVDICSARIK
jgi:hypothetical protein